MHLYWAIETGKGKGNLTAWVTEIPDLVTEFGSALRDEETPRGTCLGRDGDRSSAQGSCGARLPEGYTGSWSDYTAGPGSTQETWGGGDRGETGSVVVGGMDGDTHCHEVWDDRKSELCDLLL